METPPIFLKWYPRNF